MPCFFAAEVKRDSSTGGSSDWLRHWRAENHLWRGVHVMVGGRIDNPDTGWKGRGLWACISTRAPFHMEGGKGTTSKVMKFQLRPDPLAR